MTQATLGIVLYVALCVAVFFVVIRYAIARDREWKRQRDAGWRYVGYTFLTGPIYAPPRDTTTRAQGEGDG